MSDNYQRALDLELYFQHAEPQGETQMLEGGGTWNAKACQRCWGIVFEDGLCVRCRERMEAHLALGECPTCLSRLVDSQCPTCGFEPVGAGTAVKPGVPCQPEPTEEFAPCALDEEGA